MQPDDLVCVYTTNDVMEAEIIKNFLNSEGITCELGDERQAGFTGVLEVELFVLAADSDRAEHLIREHQNK